MPTTSVAIRRRVHQRERHLSHGLCDTILRLAERELFRSILRAAVLEEARRNLVADGRCNEQQARHRMARIDIFLNRRSSLDTSSLKRD